MHFSTSLTVLLSLATATLSTPVDKRASAVLTVQTYNAFSVSSGVAGNALAEVNAKFPVRVLILDSQDHELTALS